MVSTSARIVARGRRIPLSSCPVSFQCLIRRFSATFSAIGRLGASQGFLRFPDFRLQCLDFSFEGPFEVLGVVIELFVFFIQPFGVLLFGLPAARRRASSRASRALSRRRRRQPVQVVRRNAEQAFDGFGMDVARPRPRRRKAQGARV